MVSHPSPAVNNRVFAHLTTMRGFFLISVDKPSEIKKGAVAFRCDSPKLLRNKRSNLKFRRNMWRDFPVFCPVRAKMAASADKGKLA